MSNLDEEQEQEIDNTSYDVEKILDVRYNKRGKPEYKLKWSGKLCYVIVYFVFIDNDIILWLFGTIILFIN